MWICAVFAAFWHSLLVNYHRSQLRSILGGEMAGWLLENLSLAWIHIDVDESHELWKTVGRCLCSAPDVVVPDTAVLYSTERWGRMGFSGLCFALAGVPERKVLVDIQYFNELNAAPDLLQQVAFIVLRGGVSRKGDRVSSKAIQIASEGTEAIGEYPEGRIEIRRSPNEGIAIINSPDGSQVSVPCRQLSTIIVAIAYLISREEGADHEKGRRIRRIFQGLDQPGGAQRPRNLVYEDPSSTDTEPPLFTIEPPSSDEGISPQLEMAGMRVRVGC